MNNNNKIVAYILINLEKDTPINQIKEIKCICTSLLF